MNGKGVVIALMAFFIFMPISFAQEESEVDSTFCLAKDFYEEGLLEYVQVLESSTCVDLSVSRGRVGSGQVVLWDFGDGHEGQGRVVSHCYESHEKFVAKAIIFDPSLNITLEVLEFEQDLRQDLLEIRAPVEGSTGEELFFDCDLVPNPEMEVKDFYWQFGNGKYACGKKASAVFSISGKHKVSLSVEIFFKGKELTLFEEVEVLVRSSRMPLVILGEEPSCATFTLKEPEELAWVDFRWDFADGTSIEGDTVRKCFSNGESQHVMLNVIDRKAQIMSMGERELDVELNQVHVFSGLKDTLLVGEPIDFQWKVSLPKELESPKYSWAIGGKEQSSEKIDVSRPFSDTLSLKVEWATKQAIFLFEEKQPLVVLGAINRKAVDELFEDEHGQGRFLVDVPHMVLFEQTHEGLIKVDSLSENPHPLRISKGKDYLLCAWKGNLIAKSQAFSTVDCESLAEAQTKYNEAFDRMMMEEKLCLLPVTYSLDSDRLSFKEKSVLRHNAKILKKYPELLVEVGSYTHTDGGWRRNTTLSQKRSEEIMAYLTSKRDGGLGDIKVVDASGNEKLWNSVGAAMEDEELNGRTELKVRGIRTIR